MALLVVAFLLSTATHLGLRRVLKTDEGSKVGKIVEASTGVIYS
jgi:hypothetical protein